MDDITKKARRFVSTHIVSRSAISMWKRRANQYGVRAVLDINHSDEEIESVTQMQVTNIFPHLRRNLNGNEEVILDFGCGPGRFTRYLADVIHGKVIGVDPIRQFLDVAPRGPDIDYRLMKKNKIPVANDSVDVVWICLVLGGIIKRRDLQKIACEVDRVLKPGGLILLIENTSDMKDGQYWKFRSVEYYCSLFDFVDLSRSSDYFDLNQRISVMTGRKRSPLMRR